MRFLKILLIIVSVIAIVTLSYILWEDFSLPEPTTSFSLFSYIFLVIILSFLNILYQLKSFRFYRRREKQQLHKKLHKVFWVAGLFFSGFLIYIAASEFYRLYIYYEIIGFNIDQVYRLLLFLVLGSLSFLEIAFLKKRIKRLKTERDTKEEIDDIGNLIT